MGQRLEQKVALVFGAGSSSAHQTSNGQACALAYAREGARVVAVDLDIERAQKTRSLIEIEGGTAVAVGADVTRSSEVKAAVEQALEVYKHIDILHNNVGILTLPGRLVRLFGLGGLERLFGARDFRFGVRQGLLCKLQIGLGQNHAKWAADHHVVLRELVH